MNKVLSIAAVAAMLSTPVFAGSLTAETDPEIEALSSAVSFRVNASAEYSVENEAMDLAVGTTAAIWLVDITPTLNARYTNSAFDFTGAEVEVLYPAAYGLDAYLTVTTDADFNYQDTVIGVKFQF